MLNITELKQLRKLIDESTQSEELNKLRNKLTDMMILQSAWNQKKRIQIEDDWVL